MCQDLERKSQQYALDTSQSCILSCVLRSEPWPVSVSSCWRKTVRYCAKEPFCFRRIRFWQVGFCHSIPDLHHMIVEARGDALALYKREARDDLEHFSGSQI